MVLSFNAKIRIRESLVMGYISLFSDPNYISDISPQGSRREIRKMNYMLLILSPLIVMQGGGSELV